MGYQVRGAAAGTRRSRPAITPAKTRGRSGRGAEATMLDESKAFGGRRRRDADGAERKRA